MPLSGDLYRFDEKDIARAPMGMGVYSLHKAGETIYIGKAEGGGGIRGRLLYHLHGENPCTRQATSFRRELHRSPNTVYADRLAALFVLAGRI